MPTCLYHKGVPASANCAQCAMPICESCTQIVADKPVCNRCVEMVKARVQADLDRNPQPVQSAQPAPVYGSAPVQNTTVRSSAAAPTASPGRLILGILASIVVGLLGAIVWEKITLTTGWNIGYLTAMLGFGVGYTIVMIGKQGGIVPGIAGGIVALLVQLVGYYMLTCDEMSKMAGYAVLVNPSFVIHHLTDIIDPLGGIIMAFGVWGGFNTPMRATVRYR